MAGKRIRTRNSPANFSVQNFSVRSLVFCLRLIFLPLNFPALDTNFTNEHEFGQIRAIRVSFFYVII
ncbi:MAG: hypothetical protein C5B50_14835 [Verrucomicrobia bacterium]|nr:MAG: hypothetical protein C5B50_14835 [Verrucomicrobiota bacterium]